MNVAWVALGLVVAVIIFFLFWSRLVEAFQAEVLETVEEIRKHLGQFDDEFTPLNEEQKRDLRVVWGTVSCDYCGYLHPGLCPRIKEIRYQANGNQERVMLWPDGEWQVPKGAHSYREVFGDEVPQPEETT